MNEGMVTKATLKGGKTKPTAQIRLDRTVKIDNEEYNIYIDETETKAVVFKVDTDCIMEFGGVIGFAHEKLDFLLDYSKYNEKTKTGIIKITEISYGK